MAELPRRAGEQLNLQEIEEKERREAAMAEARKIALQILTLTRNGLFVSLRFMDVALCQFDYISSEYTDLPFEIRSTATTGEHMIYDPRYIIQQYMRDRKALSRDYLHIVLHCVFRHPFVSTRLNREYWDLACDIAVENTVCELELKQTEVFNADEIKKELEKIREFVTKMNAENLYRYLISGQASLRDLARWKQIFHRDEHDIWWEAARLIEEEKKKQAEEEAEKQGDQEPGADSEDDQETAGNEDEDGDDDGDQEKTDADDGDSSGEEEDLEESEEASEETEGPDQEESSPEEEPADSDEEDQYDPEAEEDDENPDYDEYEDEYTSSPGGDDENGEGSEQGDPDSDTRESENESSGDGSGGGNPGEDPEQTDEEGADRDKDVSTDGLTGSDGGQKNNKDENRQSGDLSGQTDNGVPDNSEDPFGEQNQQGNAKGAEGSGGTQKDQGSQSGEHSAGSGGGGDGSQSAWQHEGGASRRSDGEIDENDMRQLDGTADPAAEVREIEGESPQEAKPQQGTKETAADDDAQKEKNPSFLHNGEQQEQLENKWKEISERMLVDLETSSREWGDKSDSMVQSLKKINRDKYDYRTFLQKFSTIKEDIQLNDEEFDYVYYIYGLNHYGNMPLIEPLEYKEARKIHDFVIAIDTSGSCAGEVVQKFLDKTYSIFSQQENFFRKINLHIIQCDATIQSDVKITDKEEFKEYMREVEFHGFGGTDFRPVFEYVDRMIDHHEFDDLRGLIYFTDGNGVYPQRRPDYETAFVFVDDDEFDYEVPSWAMKLVLETSDITEEVLI